MLFKDKYEFLSNFYYSDMIINGLLYPTVEHYYQSLKCLDIMDSEKIRMCKYPGQAKKLGRSSTLRSRWDDKKYSVMMNGILHKFSNLKLQKMLKDIPPGIEIAEDNYWHDNYWGNCLCPKCIDIEGLNNLGKILTDVKYRNRKG